MASGCATARPAPPPRAPLRPAGDPRAPLPRRLRLRPPGRRAFPLRPGAEPFLDDEERRARSRAPRACGCAPTRTCSTDERHLFYACASRPEEVLFLSWRSSDEEGNPALPSPFVDDVRAVRRVAVGAAWPAAARRRDVAARHGAPPLELRRARAAAAPSSVEPPPLPPPRTPVLASSPPASGSPRAAWRPSPAAGCGGWSTRCSSPGASTDPRADAPRVDRARGDGAHAARPARAHGLGARRAREPRGGRARARYGALRAGRHAGRRAPGRRCARSRSTCARAPRRRARPASSRSASVGGSGASATSSRRSTWAGRARGHRPCGPHRRGARAASRPRARLQEPHRPSGRAVDGGGRPAPGRAYALAARELLGLDPRGRGLPAARGTRPAPPRPGLRGGEGGWVTTDVVDPDVFDCALDDAREAAVRAARDLRAGRIAACPERCTPRGCAHPRSAGRRPDGARPRQRPPLRARLHPGAAHGRSRTATARAPGCSPPTRASTRPP